MQALLPFPSVLDMMNSDMNWTTELGNAFLAQQQDVMDAVQRAARRGATATATCEATARSWSAAGPTSPSCRSNPAFVVVPYYDPRSFSLRRDLASWSAARSALASACHLGGCFSAPWGWGAGGMRFDWGGHAVFMNNARWGRTWVNRAT